MSTVTGLLVLLPVVVLGVLFATAPTVAPDDLRGARATTAGLVVSAGLSDRR
jgi:hypothetical protein